MCRKHSFNFKNSTQAIRMIDYPLDKKKRWANFTAKV